MTNPGQKQCLPELLVNVSSVGHEDRREKHITTDGGHLALEGVTFFVPHLFLISHAGQESLVQVNLT